MDRRIVKFVHLCGKVGSTFRGKGKVGAPYVDSLFVSLGHAVADNAYSIAFHVMSPLLRQHCTVCAYIILLSALERADDIRPYKASVYYFTLRKKH